MTTKAKKKARMPAETLDRVVELLASIAASQRALAKTLDDAATRGGAR